MKYKLRKTNSITGNKVYVSQCFRFASPVLKVFFFAQFKVIIIKGMEIWVQKIVLPIQTLLPVSKYTFKKLLIIRLVSINNMQNSDSLAYMYISTYST